jgi:hypothetical protein
VIAAEALRWLREVHWGWLALAAALLVGWCWRVDRGSR